VRLTSSTGLYWSKRGEVLCPPHAEDISVERWDDDNWTPLPDSVQGMHGRMFQCSRCCGTPLVHRHRRAESPLALGREVERVVPTVAKDHTIDT
jgi:hypothetical protein